MVSASGIYGTIMLMRFSAFACVSFDNDELRTVHVPPKAFAAVSPILRNHGSSRNGEQGGICRRFNGHVQMIEQKNVIDGFMMQH
jgi:hypothetical protein